MASTEQGTTVVDHRSPPVFIHSEIDDLGLDVYAFRVYATLVRRASGGAGAYESVANMANRCRMSPRRTHQALRALEKTGLIVGDRRSGSTTVYQLQPQHAWGTPAPGAEVPLHQVQKTPAPGADKGTPTKVLQKKEEEHVGDADVAQPVLLSPERSKPDLPSLVADVVAAYNDTCGTLPKAHVISNDITRLVRGLARDHGIERVVPLVVAATRIVRDDPHWLGKRATNVTRDAAPYGLVNLLRHAVDKANIALDEALEAVDWSGIEAGQEWYTKRGIGTIAEPPRDGRPTINVLITRTGTVEELQRHELKERRHAERAR